MLLTYRRPQGKRALPTPRHPRRSAWTDPAPDGKDESDLFTIANNFALRHQDVTQKREHDPIFLDRMFWWLPAAVEVPNEGLARAASTREPTP